MGTLCQHKEEESATLAQQSLLVDQTKVRETLAKRRTQLRTLSTKLEALRETVIAEAVLLASSQTVDLTRARCLLRLKRHLDSLIASALHASHIVELARADSSPNPAV